MKRYGEWGTHRRSHRGEERSELEMGKDKGAVDVDGLIGVIKLPRLMHVIAAVLK